MATLEKGWDSYGCDPFLPDILDNEILYKRCFKADFSKAHTLNEKFDCITMWATAEHLIDSESTFLNLFSQLKPNGIFVFNSPFGNSKIALKNGRNWRMSNIVEHLQFHTIKSVKYLATIGKMSIINIRICGSPYPLGSMNIQKNEEKSEELNNIGSNKNKFDITKFIYSNIISKNKFKSKTLLSYCIDKFKIGDHLEIILKKG